MSAEWKVEASRSSTILVVRRRTAKHQDLARDDRHQIIWFESIEAAQSHADLLNKGHDDGSR